MNGRWPVVILVLVTLGTFAASLVGGFVWDDEELIKEDRFVHSVQYAGHVFTPTYWKQDYAGTEGRYRPLRALTFIAEHKLWGERPFGYHLTNVLLHLAVVLLLYRLALLLTGDRWAGFLAALLFAVHPVHVESIVWVKNRTDLLAALFYVSSFLLFIRYFRDAAGLTAKRWAVLSLVFLLALLSKENAVTLPAMAVLYLLFFEKKSIIPALRATLPWWGIAAAYLAGILIVFRSSGLQAPVDLSSSALATFQYLRLLVLPYDLNAERMLASVTDFTGPLFLGTLIYVLIRRTAFKELFFALWIVVALLPVLDVRFTISRVVAEQRLYLPSIGICLVAGALLSARPWARVAAVCIVAVFSVQSFARSLSGTTRCVSGKRRSSSPRPRPAPITTWVSRTSGGGACRKLSRRTTRARCLTRKAPRPTSTWAGCFSTAGS
jgi:hypothetical protein